jgi:hypothetical protein
MVGTANVELWLERSLAGNETAWVHLLGGLWDEVEKRVERSRMMGQLRSSVDDRREVVSRVFERLRRNELRALRTFPAWRERHPDKTFADWLAILVANVIRDYVSERLGDVDVSGAGLKRLINTLAESLDIGDEARALRPEITNALVAAELIAAARTRLAPDQWSALCGWLAGGDFAEIAGEHGWKGPEVARSKVRAAIARLRRDARIEGAA